MKRSGGRTAQAVGASFEGWVETQHDKALRLGILAHVYHNQPTAKFDGGRLKYVKKGVADYTGTLEGGYATTYAAEAKTAKKDRLYRSVIEPDQAKHLTAVANAGGLALLLAEFRTNEWPYWSRFAVPWALVPWEVAESAESVTAEILENWRVPNDPTHCFLTRFRSGGPPSTPRKGRVYPRD